MAQIDLGGGGEDWMPSYGGANTYNYTDPNVRAGATTSGTDVWKTGGTASPYDTVAHFYDNALGRAGSADEINGWLTGTQGNIGAIQQGIYGSPEAQQYSQKLSQPNAAGAAAADPYAWVDEALRSVNSTDDPAYWRRVIGADPNGSGSARDYWLDRIRRGDGSALVANGSLQRFQDTPGGGGGGGYTNAGIFDDPATAGWMKLLSSRINSLNTPYQPPSMAPLTDYLSSYFQKLQGPAYTPQQMDLLQTQSLDPLSRERDAVRQRIVEQASRRGLSPQSGIVQKQLSDADNQFEQIRTKTQAGFASKAVDLDRINAQQAASVGQLLANIEQSNFNQNEQRANQAVGYAQQIPDLARQRMLDANAILGQSQVNPAQLLQMQMGQNQFDSGQQQQYIMGLASMLPYLLKAFGVG